MYIHVMLCMYIYIYLMMFPLQSVNQTWQWTSPIYSADFP